MESKIMESYLIERNSIKVIAKIFNSTEYKIKAILLKNKVKIRKGGAKAKSITEELQIIEDYSIRKISVKKLILKYKCRYNTIINILNKYKIARMSSTDAQRKVKENIFYNKGVEGNYWLGILAADGSIREKRNSIKLKLANHDIDVLEQFKTFIDYPVNINKESSKHSTRQSCNYIEFNCKETKQFLINCGITPNKAFTVSLNLPVTRDFIRGFFDGDGCFYYTRRNCTFSLASCSKTILIQIQDFLIAQNINSVIRPIVNKQGNTLFILTVTQQLSLTLLFNLLYKDAKYFMNRKYLKFGSFIRKLINDNTPKSVKRKASLNAELANSLDTIFVKDCWASVETLQGTPNYDSKGEDKVQVEQNHMQAIL